MVVALWCATLTKAASDQTTGKELCTAPALLPALQKVSKLQGPDTRVAPLVFVSGADPAGFDLLASLFDFQGGDSGKQLAQVRPMGIAPQTCFNSLPMVCKWVVAKAGTGGDANSLHKKHGPPFVLVGYLFVCLSGDGVAFWGE